MLDQIPDKLFTSVLHPVYLKCLLNYFSIFFTVYRFPNFSLLKSEWCSKVEMKCGWAKQWDPPTLLGCIDPRGCEPPPSKTDDIYGSYEVSDTKPLDVGTTYWYSCRAGLFRLGPENYSAYLELSCINDPNGGPPFWDPPYDHNIIPFPPCEILRKYCSGWKLKNYHKRNSSDYCNIRA